MAAISKVNVGTTAVRLAQANGDRKAITFVNRGVANVFIASDSSVTAATGLTVRPQEAVGFSADPSEFWAIAASGTQGVEVAEIT